jgi:hypothetical protein
MNFPTASFFLLAGLFGSTTASAGVNCLVGGSLTVCCAAGCGAYGWGCEGGTGNYLNPGGTMGGACALEAPSYEERVMMKIESSDSSDSSDESSDTGFYDEDEDLRPDEIETIRSEDRSDESSDTGLYDEEEDLRSDEIEAIRSDDRSDESSDTGLYDEEEDLRPDEIDAKTERVVGGLSTVSSVEARWTYVNYANNPGGGWRHSECGIVEDGTDVNGHTCP